MYDTGSLYGTESKSCQQKQRNLICSHINQRTYVSNFLRIHKMQWDHKTKKTNYRYYIHSIQARQMVLGMGLKNLKKRRKNKTNKKHTPFPNFQISDSVFLIRPLATYAIFITKITNFLSFCNVAFDFNCLHHNVLVKR